MGQGFREQPVEPQGEWKLDCEREKENTELDYKRFRVTTLYAVIICHSLVSLRLGLS